MNKQTTVFVGISGGVDSAVAALRLKQAGHKVIGVFIKVWQPDFLECNEERERLDAMLVAAHLEIPFLICDAEAVYKNAVADYFISEYKRGRTPNPDVMCNRRVKFGAFLDFALARGADYVATGHYARLEKNENGDLELWRSADINKDQSYFLWTLTKVQRDKILFPVGSANKNIVRHEATAAGLPVSNKPDSQGICFLGQVDIPDFLSHFITLIPGAVLDEAGKKIGTHQGALVYTIGQRHGFDIALGARETKAHYVVAKDLTANIIIVSETPPRVTASDNFKLLLEDTNWIIKLKADTIYQAQHRYRQQPFSVRVSNLKANTAHFAMLGDTTRPASGQSCVIYANTKCLGGGIIGSIWS